MPPITVTVDEGTYRNARIAAAAQGTSVPALVRRYLNELGSGESEFERLKRLERDAAAGSRIFRRRTGCHAPRFIDAT